MSRSTSPSKPVGSINGRGAGGGGEEDGARNMAVQHLINNQGGWNRQRETSPLITTVAVDLPATEEARGRAARSRVMTRVVQLLGVALLLTAALFGLLAFRRGQRESVPFPSVTHPYKPSALWGPARRPFPTGAWWTNLMLEAGDQNVGMLPYAVKATAESGVQVSYSRWRHLSSDLVEADLFAPDLMLSSVEEVSSRALESYDPLSVGLMFKTKPPATPTAQQKKDGPPFFRTNLVRGCPYVTVEYQGTTPNISSEFPIVIINGLLMKDNAPFLVPRLTGEVFDCTIISSQQWMLFASPAITLKWTPQGLVAEQPYTGFIRAAFVPDPSWKPVLQAHWRAYPSGGRVLLDYNEEDMITVQWRKKGDRDTKLLMLALPHHLDLLQGAKTLDKMPATYVAMKGPMTAVVGDRWFLKESVPNIKWTAPRKIQDPLKLAKIRAILPLDVKLESEKALGEDPDDPYWAGKQMARLARLALIAEEVGLHDHAKKAVSLAEGLLEPWLTGQNQNPLLYDQVWGGLIIKRGLTDPYVNFGNSYYNDHHFQYGYFIYTAAVIAKLDPGFVSKYRRQLDAIVADVVNYDESSNHFPIARHKDFYDGHSWASGLFVQNNGKSQESSSEAINCYYAASLYGEAVGDVALQKFAGLLMAMEIRSTKYYWHMRTNDTVYDPAFSANKMVGVVGALDVTCHTWFGTKFEYVHGINFMPFTPITEAYLDRAYVSEEYPVLRTVLEGSDPVDAAWRGLIFLDYAILDPNAAWPDVLSLGAFDSGNSLTNSLYWVATRPDAGPAPAPAPTPAPTPAPPTPAPSSAASSDKTGDSDSSSSKSGGGSSSSSKSSSSAAPVVPPHHAKLAASSGPEDEGVGAGVEEQRAEEEDEGHRRWRRRRR